MMGIRCSAPLLVAVGLVSALIAPPLRGQCTWVSKTTSVVETCGNVGIGTQNPLPNARLQVVGDSELIGSTPQRIFGNSDPNNYFIGHFPVTGTDGLDVMWYGGIRLRTVSGVGVLVDIHSNVGIGTSAPRARLDVNGSARVSGDLLVDGNLAAKYQDVAEWVGADEDLAPGTVVTLRSDTPNEVTISRRPYDTTVAGVVSARPGLILGESGTGREMVATFGRVKVKVDASVRPIRIGDLLVSSDRPGHAMVSEPLTIQNRSIHQPGTIIGKALEPLPSGQGEILVLLSLQ